MKKVIVNVDLESKTPVYHLFPGTQEACDAFLDLRVEDDSITLVPGYTFEKGNLPYDVAMGTALRIDIPAEMSGQHLKNLETDNEFCSLVNRLVAGHSIKWDGNNDRGQFTEDALEADQEISMFFNTSDYIEIISDVYAWVEADFEISELAEKGLREYADDLENALEGNQAFGSDIDATVLAVAKSKVEDLLENEQSIKGQVAVVKILIENDIEIDLSLDVDITDVEIIDNCNEDEEGNIQPSEISALVGFTFVGEAYSIDFKTTTTSDYGAYSSKLAAYDGSDDYDRFVEAVGDDMAQEILSVVLKESDAQEIRNKYVSENYSVSDESYGGMDGNSETNKATRK